jgi:TolA-binding protein
MRVKNKYNFRGQQGYNNLNDPDNDLLMTAEDSAILESINVYFKGYLDIEDVKSDRAYSKTLETAKNIISDFQDHHKHNSDIEKFITESMSGKAAEAKIIKEISQIKKEIIRSDLNDISSEWVKEWHEKKLRNGGKDGKTEQIRKFITGSLEPTKSISAINSPAAEKRSVSFRIRLIRYLSLAAAVIAGTLLLIRPLLPSHNPDKIFSKYYEPYPAVSSVIRGQVTGGNEKFNSALESYKAGSYQVAAAGFSEIMLNDFSSSSARFFLGITQIALNNFNQASDLLDAEVKLQGEYMKEALWYLGLAYIKTGNKTRAAECFELLVRISDYYRKPSEKILRRLK